MLKRNGADINAKDSQGNNILHVASMYGLHEAIPFLREIGLNIDSKNDNGETALFLAADHNQALSLFILLKSGAGKALVSITMLCSRYLDNNLNVVDAFGCQMLNGARIFNMSFS